jgi:hypothetical protein
MPARLSYSHKPHDIRITGVDSHHHLQAHRFGQSARGGVARAWCRSERLLAESGVLSEPASCSAQELTAVQKIIAAGYPVVVTEFGDYITSTPSNTAQWASVLLPFADKLGVSYLGWTWDLWTGFNQDVLITDEAGDPTYGYGTYVKQHYLCVASGASSCP